MKPQYLKSINTLNNQPERMTTKTEHILLLDLAGAGTGEIAKLLGMSDSWVSIVKNCPMYKDRFLAKQRELEKAVIEKHSGQITNEAVRMKARENAMDLLEELITIARTEKQSFAKIAAIKEVFKRGGFDEEKKRGISIEISEKWAERWDSVLRDDTSRKPERKYKIRVTEEMPQ